MTEFRGDPDGSPEEPSVAHRYPSVHHRPQRFRSRRANGIAALALLAALAVVVLVLALST